MKNSKVSKKDQKSVNAYVWVMQSIIAGKINVLACVWRNLHRASGGRGAATAAGSTISFALRSHIPKFMCNSSVFFSTIGSGSPYLGGLAFGSYLKKITFMTTVYFVTGNFLFWLRWLSSPYSLQHINFPIIANKSKYWNVWKKLVNQ